MAKGGQRNAGGRSFMYSLGDNIIGYDDGVQTPGERLGTGINSFAVQAYSDPIGLASSAIRSAEDNLRNLMFEGGAQQRPWEVMGYAAAPMAVTRAPAGSLRSGALMSADDVQAALRSKYPGVDVSITGSFDRGFTINKIVVPKSGRGAGVGSAIMDDLTRLSNEAGVKLQLSPSGDFGGSVPRLKKFYKRFGFVENKGRNRDFSSQEQMYRVPNGGSGN